MPSVTTAAMFSDLQQSWLGLDFDLLMIA